MDKQQIIFDKVSQKLNLIVIIKRSVLLSI